jgi:hypothetical protein
VIHQYRGENFRTDGWEDSVGQADMSISGVSPGRLNGERAASSDGVDDFGLADGPQNLPENETFAVAFVIKSNDLTDLTQILGCGFNPSLFRVIDKDQRDNTLGELLINFSDQNRETIEVETDNKILDGSVHLVVINVNLTQGGSGVDFYVDDMSSPESTTVPKDGDFSSAAYEASPGMRFFAGEFKGSVRRFKSFNASLFEFKESTYTLSQRQALKRRRPEISDP